MITFQGWGMGRKGLWSLFLPQMLVCVCVCVCVYTHMPVCSRPPPSRMRCASQPAPPLCPPISALPILSSWRARGLGGSLPAAPELRAGLRKAEHPFVPSLVQLIHSALWLVFLLCVF